jgi:hypothetical protein
MLQRRFHYNQDYTKKSVDGKKSFNNDIYYCSDGVGIHIFCVYSHDTPNEYGKNERWRGKREKRERVTRALSCVYHQRERNVRRRQPAGRFFISLLLGRWYKTIENQSRYFTITLLLAQSMIDHITHCIDNKIRFSRRYGAVGTIRVREPAFEADCCSSLSSLHARCAQPLCCTVRAV